MARTSTVSIIGSDYENPRIDEMLEPLGGMGSFVSKGERVLLKINLLSASDPMAAITTHPSIVKAVAESVMNAGATPFIGDSPGGSFSKRALTKAYKRTGMSQIADDLGIELNMDTSWKTIPVKDGLRLKKTQVCNFALDADRIIALPKLKTHMLMTMTLATKIMYGIIPGLRKGKYHAVYMKPKAFGEMLLDVLTLTPPDLFILDGVLAMEGEGPGSGKPVSLGVLMASTDAFAMDLAVCDMLNIEPMGVPTLRSGRVTGRTPEKIEYPLRTPDVVRYKGFKLPSTAGKVAKGKKKRKSPLVNEKCIACGKCVEICPKDAIKIEGDRASVDHGLCIRCYCCHEICPAKAIDLKTL